MTTRLLVSSALDAECSGAHAGDDPRGLGGGLGGLRVSPRPPQAPRIVTVEEGGINPALLEALATRLKLFSSEWRIVICTLISPQPPSARAIAKRLGAEGGNVRRVTRALIQWRVLTRLPCGGLAVEADPEKWGPPDDAPAAKGTPSRRTGSDASRR